MWQVQTLQVLLWEVDKVRNISSAEKQVLKTAQRSPDCYQTNRQRRCYGCMEERPVLYIQEAERQLHDTTF